jgi:hypothetical protein
MTPEQLFQLHQSTCGQALETMKRKNHDYTAGSSPFANFNGSSFLGIDPIIGILMRIMDKFMRIRTFVQVGTLLVKGESVDDAIEDSINYLILAKGMIIERIEQKREEDYIADLVNKEH